MFLLFCFFLLVLIFVLFVLFVFCFLIFRFFLIFFLFVIFVTLVLFIFVLLYFLYFCFGLVLSGLVWPELLYNLLGFFAGCNTILKSILNGTNRYSLLCRPSTLCRVLLLELFWLVLVWFGTWFWCT